MKTYKLEGHGRLLMVRACVEGTTGKAYSKLLIDTGSAFTIISQEMLESIGCDPSTALRRQRIITGSGYEIVSAVVAKGFHCLGESIENYEILAHTLPFGTYVDGLLGMDFMSRFDLEIRISRAEMLVR